MKVKGSAGNGAVSIEIDRISLANIEKKLGSMKSEAPKVLKNAVNRTAKDARKDLIEEAQRTYVVKSGRFNKAAKITNATVGNLQAVINIKGAPLELHDYKSSPASPPVSGRRPSVTRAKVLASGGLKPLQKGSLKAFVTRFASGHVSIGQRTGSKRTPIKKLMSNSIPTMIGNENRVYGVVRPDIEKNLRENVEKQIRKVLYWS